MGAQCVTWSRTPASGLPCIVAARPEVDRLVTLPAVGFFQDVTMRLIANHIVSPGKGETYLQGEVSVHQPIVPHPQLANGYHVYCSGCNEGASALVCELAETFGVEIRQASNVGALESCDCMLVYLTGLTWTRGEDSAVFAAEVQMAMDKQVPLLLAHESTPWLLFAACLLILP